MNEAESNPYMRMPLDQVKSDARAGVILARQALRLRAPETAHQALGPVLEPGEEAQARRQRIMEAASDYQKSRTVRRGKAKASR
jgi:hypothetical protein